MNRNTRHTKRQGRQPAIPPAGVPLRPSTFCANPKDLAEELKARADRYRGEKWLTCYSFPNYVKTAVDRFRALAPGSRSPELMPTLACALHLGTKRFYAQESVNLFREQRRRALCADLDGDDLEELASWLRTCRLSVPDYADSGFRQQNIQVPEKVKAQLGALANDLGISDSVLGTFAVMAVLADAPTVPAEYRHAMAAAVAGFEARMAKRARRAQVLVSLMLEER